MRRKILIRLLVIFAVVLSAGTVYAETQIDGPGSSSGDSENSDSLELHLPGIFTLEDDDGAIWNLNIAFGVVLYGAVLPPGATESWPAYGFIFGDEMVLWADGPGTGGWVDSLAYTGMWDFGTRIYNGTWVNYQDGGSGTVQMWPAGASAKPSEGIENGQNPWIAQSGAASDMQDGGISPIGATSGEKVKAISNPRFAVNGEGAIEDIGGLADRGAICFEDSYGFIWDLDMASGCILHGTMTWGVETFPAYGFIFGDEMFLWCNAPGEGGLEDSFVYTGMWDFGTMIFDGTWVNYPGGNSGTVQMWPCGAQPKTEYYAVIAGEGYTCSWADNDAYDLYKALMSYPNWDGANIELLVSDAAGTKHDCTRTNIMDGIAWMASVADEDDVCVLFYAGHGGYQTDVAPLDESDGYDEYICPEGGNILDDELNDWLSAIPGYKLVALDSCFSGGFIRADGMVSRSVPGLPRAEITDGFAQDFRRAEDLCKLGFNVHTACDEDESAYGTAALNNGVFTYYLVEGLYGPADSDSDGDVDSIEAHWYTNPRVISYTGGDQHPWICPATTDPLIWVLG